MDSISAQAAAFVEHLASNRSLEALGVLQREEQILQFLRINAQALYPTLSSPQFFPGRRWNDILELLTQALFAHGDRQLLPQLEALGRTLLTPELIAQVQPHRIPAQQCQRQVLELLKRLLGKPEARGTLAGPLAAALQGLPDRYLERAFEARQYVHFELAKVQRLALGLEEIKQMVKVTLLLRPAIHFLTAGTRSAGALPILVQPSFAGTAVETLRAQFRLVPPMLLRGAVFSNVSFLDDGQIDATARLAAVFAARARNYNPALRADRGADTPDRSWFSVARRNYKFYGFDLKMLEELYKIASENGW
jgi:hypothetical protein